MKIRRKVPGQKRKLDSGENKSPEFLTTFRSKLNGLKRKLNSGEDYHQKPEVLTKINTVEVDVDSDSEVVFNVPQAKKLKLSPKSADLIKKVIESKPELNAKPVLGVKPPPVLGAKPVQDENSEEIKPRRSPNGYMLSDPLPEGLVIKDLRKKTWKIGKSIGLGGFGEIYSAALLDGKTLSEEDYVVKVEPHSNGPLFVELHFYCRATKKRRPGQFCCQKEYETSWGSGFKRPWLIYSS